MKFEINIDKKHAFLILGAILLFGGGIIFAIAQVGTPSNPGHDVSQIDGIPDCGVGEYLTNDATTGFSCKVDSIGSGSCYLETVGNCPPQDGWSPPCPAGYVKVGGVDPLEGTGVDWCRVSFSLCCTS